jgi:two-component sensor histidine kinase
MNGCMIGGRANCSRLAQRGRLCRQARLHVPELEPNEARKLAQAVFDTVIEPLVVLDSDLRIIIASRSFYQAFQVNRQDTEGRLIYEVGDRQWDIPELRAELKKILPEHGELDGYDVERDFPGIGRRAFSLTARKVFYEESNSGHILLALTDVTTARSADREVQELLRQREVLLQEMQHRVANSLSIIASILQLKARTVGSEETRTHLEDAHKRVMSVAAVQDHLHAAARAGSVRTAPYLTALTESLARSMIAETRPIELSVNAAEGAVSSTFAVSLGLIVTELVINALKYAFPHNAPGGQVRIIYELAGTDWKLTVSDNGVGAPDESVRVGRSKSGLGTSIVNALAQQLDAQVNVSTGPNGTTVSVTHSAFEAGLSGERGPR